jgi:hypothetical protein
MNDQVPDVFGSYWCHRSAIMPTTTSPLTPTTHGLRVAASFNPHSGGLSSSGFCVILWKSGNYINDGLSKEEPKRGGVPEYFGRGVDH